MTTTMTNQKWLDEFTIALRLREVRGTAIGDAIAEVETHCAESGESATEAFGDPREYASSLEFAPRQLVVGETSWTKALAPIAAGLVAINLVGPATKAFIDHTALVITWGWLVALVALALGAFLMVRLMGALLVNKVNLALFFAGLLALVAGAGMLITKAAFTITPWAGVIVAVVLLVCSVIGQRMAAPQLDDPLVDPRTPDRQTRGARLWLVHWIFPIVALAMLLLNLIPVWLR